MRGLWKLVAVTAVVTSCMVGLIQTQSAMADPTGSKKVDKVTICHRTDSYTNPYIQETVAQSSVDGNAGNDNGQGDHYLEHTGPVFYPAIPKHTKWGDIIPPIAGIHDGLNWTAAGQAIWSNSCHYIAPVIPPAGAADVHYAVACDVDMQEAVITFINSGDITGSAVLNAEIVSVPTNQSVVRTIPTGEDGVQITISIGETQVYNEMVSCQPGKGGGPETPPTDTPPVVTPPTTPTTPATPETPVAAVPHSLPLTGTSGWVVTLIASGLAAVTMVVSTVARSLFVKSL